MVPILVEFRVAVYCNEEAVPVVSGDDTWEAGPHHCPFHLIVQPQEDSPGGFEYEVTGTIADENGSPLSGLLVKAFDRALFPDGLFDVEVGWAITDANGKYRILYNQSDEVPEMHVKPDLIVAAFDPADEVEAYDEEPLCESDCMVDVPRFAEVDLVAPVRFNALESDYEHDSVQMFEMSQFEYAEDAHYENIPEDSLDALYEQDPHNARSIEALIDAQQSSKETGIPPETFYAFAKEGIQPDSI